MVCAYNRSTDKVDHFLENEAKGTKVVGAHSLEEMVRNGILLPKLFWPTVRKNCSSDREKLVKFEAEGQFIQTVKGQNKFW